MSERTVAEIIGWHDSETARVVPKRPTPDDMLAWLDGRDYDIDIDYEAGEVSVWLKTWSEWDECHLPGPCAKKYRTLHAALEAAVRAVAGAGDDDPSGQTI